MPFGDGLWHPPHLCSLSSASHCRCANSWDRAGSCAFWRCYPRRVLTHIPRRHLSITSLLVYPDSNFLQYDGLFMQKQASVFIASLLSPAGDILLWEIWCCVCRTGALRYVWAWTSCGVECWGRGTRMRTPRSWFPKKPSNLCCDLDLHQSSRLPILGASFFDKFSTNQYQK